MKWIYHKREERVIYPLTTNRQTVIYLATNFLFTRIYFDFITLEMIKFERFLQIFTVLHQKLCL